MKKLLTVPLLLAALALAGCTFTGGTGGTSGKTDPEGEQTPPPFTNPGDNLGGGGIAENPPTASDSQTMEDANAAAGETEQGGDSTAATPLTAAGKITEGGDYLVSGAIEGKISVKAENVHLFLDGATLSSADDKVITSDYDLTITLSGENSISTTAENTNAVSCDGHLTINGTGSLTVNSTKNAVKGNAITVAAAALTIEADGDGLHAEIDAYDDLTAAPTPSYEDGGWVVIDGASVTVKSGDDGIQADTFVLVKNDSSIDITTNGGAPQTITEQSSDNGNGKGIKAGAIDWGAEGSEIVSDLYFIGIEGGTVTVNANDDAIHSDGEIEISGGTLDIASGDDAVHAESLLTVSGGEITVTKCYEGLEAAKLEISGGTVDVVSVDDGLNAADGTTLPMGQANQNCHLIISGGNICVDAEGDGVDSNGSIRMTGGTLVVYGPTRADNAALDADGGILIDGGYLFAVGPLGMVETPASNSAQNVVSFAQNQSISSGTNLSLTDAEGNTIASITTRKACQSVIISCPELTAGSGYKIYGGDTELCSFTVSGTITTVGSSGGMGNPGGMPPGGGHGGPGGFGGGGRW